MIIPEFNQRPEEIFFAFEMMVETALGHWHGGNERVETKVGLSRPAQCFQGHAQPFVAVKNSTLTQVPRLNYSCQFAYITSSVAPVSDKSWNSGCRHFCQY